MTPFVVQLEPAGDGPSLRERLAAAAEAVAPDVRLAFVAVVVELVPVADERPDAVKVRRALKAMARRCALRADWNAKAGRPPRRAARKVKASQRASHGRGGAPADPSS